MKSKTPKLKVALTLAILAGFTVSSKAAVTVTFGETVPTSNIITSYEAAAQGALGWLSLGEPENPEVIRFVAETFTTPIDSDYVMNAVTMKLHFTIGQSFPAPSGFAIDFYRLTSPGQSPETGTFMSTQYGSMQPTTSIATAGSYLTLSLDTSVALEAGVSYGYVLSFSGPTPYNLLHLAISDNLPGALDPSGNRAWLRQDGGAWSLAENQTYVYYIEGSAVPEPGTVALFGLAGVVVLAARRKVAVGNKA